ncbi:hypothetical protein TcasGA2_TC001288 [Tribolium castaneum]|uniref:Uncharacterized protein n=1 Tax=Tribolium castaneum TaxID=7070 RepID=D6WBQ7_TRICA|nr:hypothetical protein TcasGA2_TC001288 [Tribolium castaneum]
MDGYTVIDKFKALPNASKWGRKDPILRHI